MRDRKDLKNYRPLSLTNTDYKIVAFIFARRLQKIIDGLIGNEQSAYIKGRFIGENARWLLDVFEYCENTNNEGILLMLDFEKAFDAVEWNFLFKVLKNFNFGENFITWIKILYTNTFFKLKNNGWISKSCRMYRGIRQGCPISAILYLFVAEILALSIKQNNTIKGISIPNMSQEIKNIQHADDLTLLLKDTTSMKQAIGVIEKFCHHAGSQINYTKTECILLGSLKNSVKEISGIKTTNKAVKCLGIYLGHDTIDCYDKNWMKTYHDIEKMFESWRKRRLTLFGKTCIINSLAISKFIYVASILPIPDENLLKNIKRSIFNFLWNKTDRIKRNTLIGNVSEGGIGVVDIYLKIKAIKASWIQRISNKGVINYYVTSFCKPYNVNINYLLKTTEKRCEYFKIVPNLPIFYKEIFTCFNECKRSIDVENLSNANFLLQPIWNNDLFKYKNETLCFPSWIKSNFIYVKDLLLPNGTLKKLENISDELKDKSNWLCEYGIINNVFKKILHIKDLDLQTSFFLKDNNNFNFKTGYFDIKGKRCSFYYSNLVKYIFKKPYYQSFYSRLFKIEKDHWNLIYKAKISLNNRKLAEFNYKLINDILSNYSFLFKIKARNNPNCSFCNDTENSKHLLFDCISVKSIWFEVSAILNFDVKWRHIIFGFYLEENSKVVFYNTLLSFIAYRIYKYKMYCRIDNINETEYNVKCSVRNSLATLFTIPLFNNRYTKTINNVISALS